MNSKKIEDFNHIPNSNCYWKSDEASVIIRRYFAIPKRFGIYVLSFAFFMNVFVFFLKQFPRIDPNLGLSERVNESETLKSVN